MKPFETEYSAWRWAIRNASGPVVVAITIDASGRSLCNVSHITVVPNTWGWSYRI